jgi:tetratricopeptide (TPR) repeat protein
MKEKNKKARLSKNTNSTLNKGKKSFNPWLIIAGIVVFTVVVFLPMLQNQFTSWDDPDYITNNMKIWKLNAENLKFIFTQPIAYNYHPLTMLSLGINYYFSKLNPFSYFLTNLILHLTNVVLVFWFIFSISKKNINVATFVALVFAIHPMHVESVAWATERKDVLYTLFFIGGLITWLHYLRTNKLIYFIATILLAIFSMLSKPAAIIFPLVIIAIDFYEKEKFEIKAQLNKIPFFIIAAFFMYMTLIAQTQDNSIVGDFKKYTVIERFLFASYGFVVYILKLFAPAHLATFHPYPKSIEILVYLSPIIIALLVAFVYYFKEKRKLLLFGLMFYFINLILVLQFVSIGDAVYAERYTYVPYIGLCFILGMLLFNSNIKINRNLIWGGIAAYSLVFAYSANARVKVWHNSETLWTDMIEKYPDSDRGYYDLGNYYFEKGDNEKAIPLFGKAIKVGTNYKSYANRGLALMKQLKYDEAIQDFNKAIELKPKQDEAFLGRAHAYGDLKKYDLSMSDVNEALKFRESYESYFFRGYLYKATENYDLAIENYSKAMTLTKEVSVYNNRGNVYFLLKDYAKAIADYNVVLNQNPNDPNGLSNRGAAYFQSNQFEAAMVDINKAISLDPNNARNFTNLALMYQKQGNKAKALEIANKAQKLGASFPADFLRSIQN